MNKTLQQGIYISFSLEVQMVQAKNEFIVQFTVYSHISK